LWLKSRREGIVKLYLSLACSIIALGWLCAAAQAGTVSLVDDADSLRPTFQADPGETNHVTLVVLDFLDFRITDSGAPLTAGFGCVSVDANTVDCHARATDGIEFYAGDLDDFISLASSPRVNCCEAHQLFGEDGDDVLIGGPSLDAIDGGAGNDVIFGGGSVPETQADESCELCGENLLFGGTGDDTILGGGNGDDIIGGEGADVMSGAEGFDAVFYDFGIIISPGPVQVSLDNLPDDGIVGEDDNVLSDIEFVRGTSGNDVLVGNDGPNWLAGGLGNDILEGRRGNDVLEGWDGADILKPGPGRDTAYGNAGADIFRTRDGARDGVFGGRGVDKAHKDRFDVLRSIEKLF
jgi:Ca2+-binding RTX toxin-like protein